MISVSRKIKDNLRKMSANCLNYGKYLDTSYLEIVINCESKMLLS